jgi:hypothetical protein
MFRCDGGKEFASAEVHHVLSNCGIMLLLSVPYAPQEKEAAEHKNRTVVELTQSRLSVSELPKLMWLQTCETKGYVLKCTAKAPVIGKSPMELSRN